MSEQKRDDRTQDRLRIAEREPDNNAAGKNDVAPALLELRRREVELPSDLGVPVATSYEILLVPGPEELQ